MRKSILEMVVKGFDCLTGVALFISAFGLGFNGYKGLTTLGWIMGEAMQDTAVMSAISQLPPSFKMLKGTPNEKETLEQMVNELEF